MDKASMLDVEFRISQSYLNISWEWCYKANMNEKCYILCLQNPPAFPFRILSPTPLSPVIILPTTPIGSPHAALDSPMSKG